MVPDLPPIEPEDEVVPPAIDVPGPETVDGVLAIETPASGVQPDGAPNPSLVLADDVSSPATSSQEMETDEFMQTWTNGHRPAYMLPPLEARLQNFALHLFTPAEALAAPSPSHLLPADEAPLNHALSAEIDLMNSEIDQSFTEALKEARIQVYFAGGASATIAMGAMSYLLRGGSLLSSFLATVPLWKSFDPVAILLAPKRRKKKKSEADAGGDHTGEGQAEQMFSQEGGA